MQTGSYANPRPASKRVFEHAGLAVEPHAGEGDELLVPAALNASTGLGSGLVFDTVLGIKRQDLTPGAWADADVESVG